MNYIEKSHQGRLIQEDEEIALSNAMQGKPEGIKLDGYVAPDLQHSVSSGRQNDPFKSSRESVQSSVREVQRQQQRQERLQSAMEHEGSCVWTL